LNNKDGVYTTSHWHLVSLMILGRNMLQSTLQCIRVVVIYGCYSHV